MPQLQINQGPQDALLYDNTRSYFTNVGYVRTSNFQMELRDVDPQNTAQLGSTVQFVIPKAADLLGPVDLRVKLTAPAASGISGVQVADSRAFCQWVDELGFAMIEKCTFSVGSNDIETITGEQMQIKNELMTSDEQRLGFDSVLKTGRRAFSDKTGNSTTSTVANERPGDNQVLAAAYHKKVNKDFSRLISYRGDRDPACAGATQAFVATNATDTFDKAAHGLAIGDRVLLTDLATTTGVTTDTYYWVHATDFTVDKLRLSPSLGGAVITLGTGDGTANLAKAGGNDLLAGEREMVIPLSLFFTKHVSQYFPLAAVAGCNDVRISIKFRAFNELVQISDSGATAVCNPSLLFSNSNPIKSGDGCQLRCHYVHVTGPEATTLMNKEHVRLLKLWQHQSQQFTSVTSSFDLDLSFLHPITTLIITIRRIADISSDVTSQSVEAAQKGYFFYHGDGTNPNYDRALLVDGTLKTGASKHTVKVSSIQLSLNGQERHPGLTSGIDSKYLQSRLLPMLHSNSNALDKQIQAMSSAESGAYGYGAADILTSEDVRSEMKGSKSIFVYPFSLNPEGSNPSGAVNFSKVSHAKLKIFTETSASAGPLKPTEPKADAADGGEKYRVDVYGLYYNWLQIKDGRALLSFA
jgi:hypothetical protein